MQVRNDIQETSPQKWILRNVNLYLQTPLWKPDLIF